MTDKQTAPKAQRTEWAAHHGFDGGGGPDPEHPDWCEINGDGYPYEPGFSVTGHCGIERARKMAAAPEMYEALKEARQWIGYPLRDKQDQALAIAAVEKANAAIEKAEGRSNG